METTASPRGIPRTWSRSTSGDSPVARTTATRSWSRTPLSVRASQIANATAVASRTMRQATPQGSVIGPAVRAVRPPRARQWLPAEAAPQGRHDLLNVGLVLLQEALEQLLRALVGVLHVLLVHLDRLGLRNGQLHQVVGVVVDRESALPAGLLPGRSALVLLFDHGRSSMVLNGTSGQAARRVPSAALGLGEEVPHDR